jgi:hypothetical protein
MNVRWLADRGGQRFIDRVNLDRVGKSRNDWPHVLRLPDVNRFGTSMRFADIEIGASLPARNKDHLIHRDLV